LTSFNGGELSPRMLGRVDQAIYQISAAEMLNFVPTVEGPAVKRAGFRHIRAADVTGAWLSPFIFSVTQAYVLEWGNLKVRFYTNGGRIETAPNVAYEVTVPYTAAEAPLVSQQQSYDRLYLAHPAHPPAALTRTGGATFSLRRADAASSGPFADQNTDESITVSPPGVDGRRRRHPDRELGDLPRRPRRRRVPARGAGFLGDQGVGSRDGRDRRRNDDRAQRRQGLQGDRRGRRATAPAAFSRPTRGAEWDGSGGTDVNAKGPYGVQWTYLHDRFGMVTITAIGGGGTTATATVTRRLPDSLSAGTFRWSHAAISAAAGWPKIVLLAFGRLIFFTDFEIIARSSATMAAAASISRRSPKAGCSRPTWRSAGAWRSPTRCCGPRRTATSSWSAPRTAIYAIRKINSGQIFSSDNIECVKQSRRGAARCGPSRPTARRSSSRSGGKKLREAGYSLDSDRYVAPNINVWQRHILKGGALQLAFQGEPEELLLAVRGDGEVALHPHVPEQETRGFSRLGHAAGGPVGLRHPRPGRRRRRAVGAGRARGDGYKSVEQQAQAWEEGETALADAFFVDSGATYSGAPTTTVSGADAPRRARGRGPRGRRGGPGPQRRRRRQSDAGAGDRRVDDPDRPRLPGAADLASARGPRQRRQHHAGQAQAPGLDHPAAARHGRDQGRPRHRQGRPADRPPGLGADGRAGPAVHRRHTAKSLAAIGTATARARSSPTIRCRASSSRRCRRSRSAADGLSPSARSSPATSSSSTCSLAAPDARRAQGDAHDRGRRSSRRPGPAWTAIGADGRSSAATASPSCSSRRRATAAMRSPGRCSPAGSARRTSRSRASPARRSPRARSSGSRRWSATTSPAECRWAELVGFELGAVLRRWGPEGKTHRLYERIRDCPIPSRRRAGGGAPRCRRFPLIAIAITAGGQIFKGVAANKAGKFNQKVDEANAIDALREGSAQVSRIRDAARLNLGQQIGAQAESGFEVGTGPRSTACSRARPTPSSTRWTSSARRAAATTPTCCRGSRRASEGKNALISGLIGAAGSVASGVQDYASGEEGRLR
jgi:hypothetical protein